MGSRPRGGRGMAGRDGKETDLENDLLSRAVDSLRKAQGYNDQSKRIGLEIVALEEEIKTNGHSTPENHRRLDALYRENLRYAEMEKKVHDDEDIINNLAILATMKTNDDLAPRNGQQKSRKHQRPTVESDTVVESPGPSPGDGRLEMMKRVKGTSQRSSSTASQNRAVSSAKDDGGETHRGIQAEKAGLLVAGTEVFYKYPKDQQDNEEGVGIHGIIKKVWQDKKPIQYDVRDPEDDASGKLTVRKATARDLVPIPQTVANIPQFPTGANVYAKYPDTDTFYRAKVKSFQKGMYSLKFDEDDKEMLVDVRFVLDSRLK
ncbi:hypothetical protein A1O1_03953 [Capronia coronata CBS 617.96]|uniref:SGF29 C-terminal domain-containing protein n=1 Tax=Capronia coronata CBS 617.96 TaxID=1182541 RepID=W9YEC2_9EURO|nr:uncharacterized protein A1O1_03953 [Capronia coronata CBS 617.96]EXJ90848.1 hypothetical protein A1O1_03953 [Capronia coronata CBS 617.96]